MPKLPKSALHAVLLLRFWDSSRFSASKTTSRGSMPFSFWDSLQNPLTPPFVSDMPFSFWDSTVIASSSEGEKYVLPFSFWDSGNFDVDVILRKEDKTCRSPFEIQRANKNCAENGSNIAVLLLRFPVLQIPTQPTANYIVPNCRSPFEIRWDTEN